MLSHVVACISMYQLLVYTSTYSHIWCSFATPSPMARHSRPLPWLGGWPPSLPGRSSSDMPPSLSGLAQLRCFNRNNMKIGKQRQLPTPSQAVRILQIQYRRDFVDPRPTALARIASSKSAAHADSCSPWEGGGGRP